MNEKCQEKDCQNFAAPGELFCDNCAVRRFVDAYLARHSGPPSFCKHPENCQAKAHHPGDPITPDFRHCVECASQPSGE